MDSAFIRFINKPFSKSQVLWMIFFILVLIDVLLVMIYYIRILQAPTLQTMQLITPAGSMPLQIIPVAR